MHPLSHILMVVSILSVACGEKNQTNPAQKTEEAPLAVAEPDNATTCADDCGACVSDLRQWMAELVREGHDDILSMQTLEEVSLSTEQETIALPKAPLVIVSNTEIVFNGKVVGDVSGLASKKGTRKIPALASALTNNWLATCEASELGTREVLLQIDSKVPWIVVRQVAHTLISSGADRLVFAFLKPTKLTKPGPSPIDAETRRIDQEGHKNVLKSPDSKAGAHPFEATYGTCKPAYDAVIAGKNAETHDYLAKELPDAIASCECKVNKSSVQALHWWWSGRNKRDDGAIHVGIRVAMTGADQRMPLRADDDAPWEKASQAILNAGEGSFALTNSKDKRKSQRAKPPQDPCTVTMESGILGLLASDEATNNIFGDAYLGDEIDPKDYFGGLSGVGIGDMTGIGGLGTPGTNQPTSGEIGHGTIGTIGRGADIPSGYGAGTGRSLPRTAQVRIKSSTHSGELHKDIIRRYVRRQMPKIRYCYEKRLNTQPSLEGEIVVDFEIDESGKTQSVKARGLSEPVDRCVAKAFRSIRFPKPAKGWVKSLYTLSFNKPQK
jgi:hypothetical protein